MTKSERRAGALIRRMTEDDESLHVDYDQLAAYVDGSCSRDEKRSVQRHIVTCSACAADLRDLREMQQAVAPRPSRTGWIWTAAAAIVLVVGLALLTPTRPAPIESADDAAMRAALERGTIEIAPAALALREKAGTLMGAAPAGSDVIAPAGTFVRTTRPAFAWKPSGGATSYRVEIYDDARQLVLASPAVAEPRWIADRDLQRGRTYQWQVLANDRVIAPAPPAPPARFGVLRADAVARIDAAAKRGSHLLLAIADAREGAIDDARAELRAEQKLNPDSRAVARLVKALDAQ